MLRELSRQWLSAGIPAMTRLIESSTLPAYAVLVSERQCSKARDVRHIFNIASYWEKANFILDLPILRPFGRNAAAFPPQVGERLISCPYLNN